jgi:hypothetical protein
MTSLLYIEDDDTLKNINIDELFEKKKTRDLKQISIFNKILNRIHKRITVTGRTKRNEKFVWFQIPEYIFGEPLYDKGDCIGYIVQKLNENGFFVKYLHPNTLFISWENWVPSYVRNEIKKKRGIIVDEKGQIVGEIDKNEKSNEIFTSGGMGIDSNFPMNSFGRSPENSYSSSLRYDEKMNKNYDGNNSNIYSSENKKYNPISNYKPTGNLVYNQVLFDKLEKKII